MAVIPQRVIFRTDWSRLLRRNRAIVVLVVAAVIVAVVTVSVQQTGPIWTFIPFLKLEQALVDYRFRLRGRVPGSPDCEIVGINASSMDPSNFDPADVAKSEALQLMQHSFPWNRKVWALLLDRLMAAGAKTVVFDILFLNENDGDADLAAALQRYGDRVVIGSVFQLENRDSTDRRQMYLVPEAKLTSATKANITGCVTLPPALDEIIRRTWYWTSEMRQYGINDNSHDIISLAGLGATKFNPAITLPEGLHYINFQGPATTYPDLPIEEIFMDRVFYKSPKFEFGNIFKNKLVFVGPEAESLHDTHGTPYGEMPGVEIHTQIAGSLLQGTMLHDPPDWLALVLSIPMALVAVWASLKMTHALALSGVLAGGIVLFITVAQLMFLKGNMMIPMVAPLIAFAGSGFFGLVFNFLLEQMERARILSFFEKYVSKNVAELVLSERDEFEKSLLGEKRLVTVLFSDIRGFTTMTEDMVPANLVEQLNEYFYNMVEAVLTAEGTLQQFIGDAIMAIWGNIHIVSPYEGARLAIRTSLKMSAVLDELNAEWAKNPSRVVFNTGIGINHGEVIVGSLGHPQRMEFTTIGDGINTAARLESATKHFGCRILVGEAVEELTRNEFHYRRVGLVQFKGKSKTIEVFTPLGESSEPSPGWLQSYNRAVDLYRRREFRMAQAAFAEARVKMGCKDRLCEMYLKECETYQSNPPAADWTGAWLLTEK